MPRILALAALIVASGCVSGIPPDWPDLEEVVAEVSERHGGWPLCPSGYVNPDPFVTCITPRPSP